MRANKSLSSWSLLAVLLLLPLLLTGFSEAKPLEDLAKNETLSQSPPQPLHLPQPQPVSLSSEPTGQAAKNKTAVSAGEELNTATNQVLAGNYKYDVEILESGDNEDAVERDSSEELEERYQGHGVYSPDVDTFVSENIEMTPIDVKSSAISESHMLLSIVIVVVALVSVCLYAGLVIWRSHLEQRYGMREQLVNRDVDEEGIDDTDYHVVYPHTLSPYAPTTTTSMTRS